MRKRLAHTRAGGEIPVLTHGSGCGDKETETQGSRSDKIKTHTRRQAWRLKHEAGDRKVGKLTQGTSMMTSPGFYLYRPKSLTNSVDKTKTHIKTDVETKT